MATKTPQHIRLEREASELLVALANMAHREVLSLNVKQAEAVLRDRLGMK